MQPRVISLWIFLQLVALGVGALGVPLAARYPSPAELGSLPLMLFAQSICGAALFPLITPNGKTSIAVIAAVFPFGLLAGTLGAEPLKDSLLGSTSVALWITVLAVVRPVLGNPNGLAVAQSLAVMWVLVPPLLAYLSAEYSVQHAPQTGLDLLLIHPASGCFWAIGFSTTLVIVGLLTQKIARRTLTTDL